MKKKTIKLFRTLLVGSIILSLSVVPIYAAEANNPTYTSESSDPTYDPATNDPVSDPEVSNPESDPEVNDSTSDSEINDPTSDPESNGQDDSVFYGSLTQSPSSDPSGEWDNDELFDEYINSIFYELPYDFSFFSNSILKNTLNDSEKLIYDQLESRIKDVATGIQTNTKFVLDDLSQINLNWTASECDVSAFTQSNVASLVGQKLLATLDLSKIWYCLLADLPYDLYWHDKSAKETGVSYHYSFFSNEARITSLIFHFAVNIKYADPTASEPFKTNLDIADNINRARNAAENAKQIVDNNANENDYTKLKNYMKEICDLNTYNDSAASSMNTNTLPDGADPWQLIYVFDKNPNTNVVCEGYAKAFAYLCDLTKFENSNIACYTVYGKMNDKSGAGGGHMWNVVTMDDGKNYLVDVTNCDGNAIGSPDKLFLAALPGSASTGYIFAKDANNIVTYSYDSYIKSLYGTDANSILTLKNTDSYTVYSSDTTAGKKNLSTAQVTLSSDTFTYNGVEQKPDVNVTLDEELVDPSAYNLSISSTDTPPSSAGTHAGTVSLTITAKVDSNYTGSIIKEYTITPALPNISNVTCTNANDLSADTLPENVILTCTANANGTNVAGTIALTDAALSTGTNNYHWKFTPNDSRNYQAATGTIRLTVADREDPHELARLEYQGALKNRTYTYGNLLDLSGLVFKAVYTDGIQNVLPDSDLVYSKILSVGQTSVVVSYTNGGKTVSTTVNGFTVNPKPLTEQMISSISDQTYTGSEIRPTVTVADGNEKLRESVDYTVRYENNINVARFDAENAPATIVSGKGNYTGTAKRSFSITKRNQAQLVITPVTGKTYGDPEFTLETTGGTGNGTVSYHVPIDTNIIEIFNTNKVRIKHAGSVTITANKSGGNDYNDISASYTLTVLPKKAIIQWNEPTTFMYDGTQKEITATLSNAGNDTVPLTITENKKTDAGNYTAKITDIKNSDYTLEGVTNLTKSWSITGTDISASVVELGNPLIYNGKEQTQTIAKVTLNGTPVSYTVSDNKATSAGTYTLKITGKGNCFGTIEKDYTIAKAKPTIQLKNLSQTEGNISAVTATLTPASSDAKATVEYCVSTGENEVWTTTMPTTAGNYKVRAYLQSADAGINLYGYSNYEEAALEGKVATGTLAIGRKAASTSKDNISSGPTSTTKVIVNKDGSATTVTAETAKDGSKIQTESTKQADNSLKKVVTQTSPNGQTISTTTITDKDGQVTSVTKTTSIKNIAKNTDTTITIKKDGSGNILSAKSSITKIGTIGKTTLDGTVIRKIVQTAGTKTDVKMTVTDPSGKQLFAVNTNSSNLVVGKKLYIFQSNSKNNSYTMVNSKTYIVAKDGSVLLNIQKRATYRLVTPSEAKQIEKNIKSTIKVQKTVAVIKPGQTTKAALAKSLDMANVKKISYTAANGKIVKVSKSGTIVAKKKGSSTVAIKVLLKNGSSKTVKLQINVK